jgi:maltokinase
MTDPAQSLMADLRHVLDVEELRDWLERQRWYTSKSRHVTGVEIGEGVVVSEDPPLYLALVQTRFATGSNELYQLPLTFRSSKLAAQDAIASTDDWSVFDAVADPEPARELLRRIDAGDRLGTAEGCFSFQRAEDVEAASHDLPVRAFGVQQSNSSIVFDDQLVLKVFRKLEPGINPELEMLRRLTKRGFPNIAPLHGWYEYDGRSFAATLGVVHRFFPDAVGGWELALDQIAVDPEAFLYQLEDLAAVTADMHTALASDASDPDFAPEEPSKEALSLLTATIDENIERIFVRLPDDERAAPILGRGQDVRECVAMRAQLGARGRVIRIHGNYHLGQTLLTPQRWAIIGFDGEPARPLPERRRKRSPLRDVASMLRSFAYVTFAVQILRGRQAPADFEQRARDRFVEHYFAQIDPTLLPAGEAAVANLLSMFELEKAIYELEYELDNRPDWLPIPVAGIARLLEPE